MIDRACRVPDLPVVDPELLDRHTGARLETADMLAATDAPVRALFRRLQWIRLAEALSTPFVVTGSAVWPTRGRFQSLKLQRRLIGGAVGLRHVDARLELLRRGAVDRVLEIETLTAVHACVESADPDERETNPGLLRLGPSWFDEPRAEYSPPPSEWCAGLVRELVEVVNEDSIPIATRAAWATASLLAIHPFVDGNGRTSRLVHQLIASSSPAGFDWAMIEGFAVLRREYVDVLIETQAGLGTYDGLNMQLDPFVDFTLRRSIEREAVVRARLEMLERWWRAPWDSPDATSRSIEIAVHVWGTARLDEIALDVVEEPTCTHLVNALVEAGRLAWVSESLLATTPDHPLTAVEPVVLSGDRVE